MNLFFARHVWIFLHRFPHQQFKEDRDLNPSPEYLACARTLSLEHGYLDAARALLIPLLCAAASRLEYLQIRIALQPSTIQVSPMTRSSNHPAIVSALSNAGGRGGHSPSLSKIGYFAVEAFSIKSLGEHHPPPPQFSLHPKTGLNSARCTSTMGSLIASSSQFCSTTPSQSCVSSLTLRRSGTTTSMHSFTNAPALKYCSSLVRSYQEMA